jgi:hypothetical protein
MNTTKLAHMLDVLAARLALAGPYENLLEQAVKEAKLQGVAPGDQAFRKVVERVYKARTGLDPKAEEVDEILDLAREAGQKAKPSSLGPPTNAEPWFKFYPDFQVPDEIRELVKQGKLVDDSHAPSHSGSHPEFKPFIDDDDERNLDRDVNTAAAWETILHVEHPDPAVRNEDQDPDWPAQKRFMVSCCDDVKGDTDDVKKAIRLFTTLYERAMKRKF